MIQYVTEKTSENRFLNVNIIDLTLCAIVGNRGQRDIGLNSVRGLSSLSVMRRVIGARMLGLRVQIGINSMRRNLLL